MAWNMPIASGGEGIFWFVVIVFVIVSNIVKAMKKKQDATPPAGSPKPRTPVSKGEYSPEEELRDFLKRLSQDADQPPPLAPARPVAKPPPLPAEVARTTTSSQPGVARPPAPPYAHRARPRPANPHPEPRAPAVVQAPPLPQPVVYQAAPEPVRASVPAAPDAPTAADKRRADLVAFLKDRGCLQEAILLREILDPPLAMRRKAAHAFTA